MSNLPRLDYQQFRRVQKLVRECCNNDSGNCLLLDDGWDAHICIQSISQSLVCKYFRAAVLPLDRELEAALFYKKFRKLCCLCGAIFYPRSNRGKYCPTCAAKIHRKQKTESERRRRAASVDN